MAIVRIFATACEKDGKNFFTVPKSVQSKVAAQIEADGYFINEDGYVYPRSMMTEETPEE